MPPRWVFVLAIVLVLLGVLAGVLAAVLLARRTGADTDISGLYHNTDASMALRSAAGRAGPLRVFAIGDSTTMGVGSDSTDYANTSWPMQMVQGQLASMNASSQSFVGFGFNGWNNGPIVDNRLQVDTDWTCRNGGFRGSFCVGGGLYTTTSTSAKIKFSPTAPVDTYEIYVAKESAPIVVSLGGASTTTTCDPSISSSTGIVRFEIKMPTATTVSVTFTSPTASASKPAIFSGMISYNAARDRIIVVNAGVGGATSRAVADVPSNPYSTLNSLSVYQPDAILLNLCINSYFLSPSGTPPYIGESLTDYRASYANLIAQLKTLAVVVGHTPVVNPTVSIDVQQPYVDACRQMYNDSGISWYDFNAECDTVQNEVGRGWLVSTDTHPLKAGYKQLATRLATFFQF